MDLKVDSHVAGLKDIFNVSPQAWFGRCFGNFVCPDSQDDELPNKGCTAKFWVKAPYIVNLFPLVSQVAEYLPVLLFALTDSPLLSAKRKNPHLASLLLTSICWLLNPFFDIFCLVKAFLPSPWMSQVGFVLKLCVIAFITGLV